MPSANAAVTLDAERLLFDKGVTVVADHVASCGGILYGQMTNEGFGRRTSGGWSTPVALKMRRVFEEAASCSVFPCRGRPRALVEQLSAPVRTARRAPGRRCRTARGAASPPRYRLAAGKGRGGDLHAAGRLQSVTTEPAFARFAATISAVDGTAE